VLDGLQTFSAACGRADVLIDQLNGQIPLEVDTDIRPVGFNYAIEICEDGTRPRSGAIRV
jgi:hypothetical protein